MAAFVVRDGPRDRSSRPVLCVLAMYVCADSAVCGEGFVIVPLMHPWAELLRCKGCQLTPQLFEEKKNVWKFLSKKNIYIY